jgi:nicotinamide-nucleotide amidase
MDFDVQAASTLEIARHNGCKIATAESCTGGMIAAALTEIPGSSDVVDRGYITYSNTAKFEMLGISSETLQNFGAVSEQIAAEMANGALERSGVDISVSVTGIAGPGGSEHKPEGRVCFGIACRSAPTHTETVDFGPLGRATVRAETVKHALSLLTKFMPSPNA